MNEHALNNDDVRGGQNLPYIQEKVGNWREPYSNKKDTQIITRLKTSPVIQLHTTGQGSALLLEGMNEHALDKNDVRGG